ncbi:hypothetical protein RM553_10725 [Zunongwangia sp. F363]|uniref:Uncharacterized protein n=1 Tax=Autumnicola tepida TaxID=3075595 RepID=A0ABU3CAL9_9FLAO|nr:hypothetical protein [Zunongwangia sp. F363]MDT0643303.1 hypothetical protein [Zunongwangia sp. F363]
MQIEKKDNEILIKVPAGTYLPGLQRMIDYIKYREIASKSKASEKQIEELAQKSKSDWWEKNNNRFL